MRSSLDRYQPIETRNQFAAFLRLHAALFVVSETLESNLNPACRDPKDNQFLALLQGCAADALVLPTTPQTQTGHP